MGVECDGTVERGVGVECDGTVERGDGSGV